MNETSHILNEKKLVTPLLIVALFLSLTETVLGVAVFKTDGGIQVALTIFVITFPLLVAGAFFGTLWHKPYVFYPPTEFGRQINVNEYVEAMQRKPALLMQASEKQESKKPTENEERAAGIIVEHFAERIAINGLLFLYAYSLAHSKNIPLSLTHLCDNLGYSNNSYAWAVLSTTSASGLINFKITRGDDDVVNITGMNEKLKNKLLTTLEVRLSNFDEENLVTTGYTKEDFKEWVQVKIDKIEKYFK